MGKDSGGGNTTTIQQSDPWEGQQGYLTDVYQGAQNLYRQGPQQPFPNRTYVPFSPETQMGLDMTMQRGLGGSPVEQGMQNYVQQGMGQQQPGIGGAVQGANQLMSGIAPGMIGTMQQQLGAGLNQSQMYAMQQQGLGGQAFGSAQDFAGQAQGLGLEGMGSLAEIASGTNPYLDSQIDIAQGRAADQIQPSINATFGLAGRTGSGMHADTLSNNMGQAMGDIESSMRNNAYNQRAQSAGQLGALGLGAGQLGGDLFSRGSADSLGRLGLGGSMFQQGQNRSLEASQGLMSGGLGGIAGTGGLYDSVGQNQARAASMAPTAANFDWQNIDRIMGAGGMVEGQAGNVLQDAMNRWGFRQQAPYDAMGQYSGVIQNSILPGTMQSSTSGGNGGSAATGALGGAMTGAGLSSQLWNTPFSGGSPWGWALTGLGALAGMQ